MNDTAAPADYAQNFAANRVVDPKRAALLIVDMQYATGHRDGPLSQRMKAEGNPATEWRFARIHDHVIPNTRQLIDGFRAAGAEVVYVTIGAAHPDARDAPVHMRDFFVTLGNHVGAPAHRIIDELAPEPTDQIIRKTTLGAFASTGIDSLLRTMDREFLFMTGVSTNMCIETTAREAADRGYAVTLVEDACAATHADLHEGALRNFRRFFGTVRTTREVLDLMAT